MFWIDLKLEITFILIINYSKPTRVRKFYLIFFNWSIHYITNEMVTTTTRIFDIKSIHGSYAQNSHASRLGCSNLLKDLQIGISAIMAGNIRGSGASAKLQ